MSGLSGNVPRVIALIDLPDLQWQVKRIGGAFGHDVSVVVEQLEAGLAKLDPAWSEAWLPLSAVYMYSPLDADRPREAGRVVFKWRAAGAKRECWACYKACTHCQGGNRDPGGQDCDNPIADDLIELARDDEYDWAVVVSADLLTHPGGPLCPVTGPEDHPRLLPSDRNGPYRGVLGLHRPRRAQSTTRVARSTFP